MFLGNLCVFVPVAQTVNCGIYWVFLKVCRNAIQPISPAILCNILITLHIHMTCHISIYVWYLQLYTWNKSCLYVTQCCTSSIFTVCATCTVILLMQYVLYLYISTSRSLCAVHNMAVFFKFLNFVLSQYVAEVLSESFWDGSSHLCFYRYYFCFHIPHVLNFYCNVFIY